MVRYRFEEAELDVEAFRLAVRGEAVPLEPQVFEVLAHLIENRHRLVTRPELLDRVWGDRFVSDSALASRIKSARAAIGDDGRSQRLIRTIHGRGLQFVAEVEVLEETATPAVHVPEPNQEQSIRFATSSDGAELAVATVGSGRPLVKAANWLTHVELDWQNPVWRHWTRAFADRFEYVRYDARGCGLSTHNLARSPLDDATTWLRDLEAVVDRSEFDRFVLLGMSQGGVPAIRYAVEHPERVSHLILYGCYSRGLKHRGPEASEAADLALDLMRVGWGGENAAFRTFFTMHFIPEATSEQVQWFNELQAATASTANALALESAFHDVDISELAAQIAVPTLVVHGRRDAAVPYEEGRRLASLIPGAEFLTLDTSNHILLEAEPAWPEFLRRLDTFLGSGDA